MTDFFPVLAADTETLQCFQVTKGNTVVGWIVTVKAITHYSVRNLEF